MPVVQTKAPAPEPTAPKEYPIKPDETITVPLVLFRHMARLSHNTQARKILKAHLDERRAKLEKAEKAKAPSKVEPKTSDKAPPKKK